MEKPNLEIVAKSIYKYARISPKKVRPVLRVIRGKKVMEATKFLKFDTTKAAKMVLKTLRSALANAQQKGYSANELVVSKATADEAPTFKRGRIGSRSHFARILKRNSHITMEVSKKEAVNG